MKIAIDAVGIDATGGGRSATLNLLERLVELGAEHQYLIILSVPEPSLQASNVKQLIAPTKGRMQVRLWAQITWRNLFIREKVDLVHHIKCQALWGSPCPSIVTVYDLTVLAHPEFFPRVDVLYWQSYQRLVLPRADHVIAISHMTARDLRHFYGIPEKKLSVIYPRISSAFRPPDAEAIARVRSKYQLPEHYLLHVGSISPKKNLAVLVQAYRELKSSGRYAGDLVLVGRNYSSSADPALAELLAGANDIPVHMTGAVPQEDLSAIMGAADCFVFPSLHEGFGMVSVEAMACGTPVVAAHGDAIAEATGDAGVLVDDPTNPEAFATAVYQITSNPTYRQILIGRGLDQAKRYNTDQPVYETLGLYERLVRRVV
ncbi:MAG: glycosyltransferase family 4 protein [Chloroflexi bacterium]|nr:glycosyltransferase family 4 protein [Chloroflexota bacterium]